ncbi:MAG: hypothetical protein R2705_22600 [Ilumatobacteraceae bacterium]
MKRTGPHARGTANADPLAPESTLYRISNRDFDGGELCDCYEAIDIPGTDRAVFELRTSWRLDDRDPRRRGRQILQIEYQSSAAGEVVKVCSPRRRGR